MNLTSQHGQSILIGQVESRKLTFLYIRNIPGGENEWSRAERIERE